MLTGALVIAIMGTGAVSERVEVLSGEGASPKTRLTLSRSETTPEPGAAPGATGSANSRAQGVLTAVRVSAPETCRSARNAVRWYRGRQSDWLKLRTGVSGVDLRGNEDARGRTARPRSPRNCADARYLAGVSRMRSFRARTVTERWVAKHVLRDFRVVPGEHAWHQAVEEAQRPYPGTSGWLLSCSDSEGGHGRWVPNSQGSGVGGWMQFHPGTFAGFSWRARVDAARRGYVVPASAASWYSPLGQALAGAWGVTHGMRHHWAGTGC